jgi:hypothetical protein
VADGESLATIPWWWNWGLAQAKSQIFQKLREVSSALVVAKRKPAQLLTLFRRYQPAFHDAGTAAPQDHTNPLLVHAGSRSASGQLRADESGESADIEWFYDDFIRFQKDGGHGPLHVGIAADQQRKSGR